MDERTYEITLRIMAEKISLLEWQLKNALEDKAKLIDQNRKLENDYKRVREELANKYEADFDEVNVKAEGDGNV